MEYPDAKFIEAQFKELMFDHGTLLRQLGEIKAERDRYKKALTKITDQFNKYSHSIAGKIAREALEGEQ